MKGDTIRKLHTCFLVFTIFMSSLGFAQGGKNDVAENDSLEGNKENGAIENIFDGFSVGADIGLQNIFSGAFIDNLDVLTQDSRVVLEFTAGWRKQFDNRLQIGVEGKFGFFDGNLMRSEPENQLEIKYENNTQVGYGVTGGYVLGSRENILLFGYATVTIREFDILIQDELGSYTQTDKEGLLRYGIGMEMLLTRVWHLRGTIGALNIDFGDKETNIDVENKIDFSIGFVYQL